MKTIKNFLFKKRIKILKNNKGFSLMEVLVAVGIIAIVSAIAVPEFQDYRRQAGRTAGDTSIGNIGRAYQSCMVLKKFEECNNLSAIGINCEDCTSNNDTANKKFCAQIQKETAGKTFRVCVDFDGSDLVGRAYGGDLFSNIKLCHETGVSHGTNSGVAFSERAMKGAKECVNPTPTCNTTATKTEGTSPNHFVTTYTCKNIDVAKGVCQSSGICSR